MRQTDYDALVCPDCIVGEPHVCPFFGLRRNFPRDDPPPRYLAAERKWMQENSHA